MHPYFYLAQRWTGSRTRLSSVAMYKEAVLANSFRFLLKKKTYFFNQKITFHKNKEGADIWQQIYFWKTPSEISNAVEN